MTSIRNQHRADKRQVKELFEEHNRKVKAGGRTVFRMDIYDLLNALNDPRLVEGVLWALRSWMAAAKGKADRQDCFVCCQPWSWSRTPAGVGIVEFIERDGTEEGNGVMFGICRECWLDKKNLLTAVRRDFGDEVQVMPGEGTA